MTICVVIDDEYLLDKAINDFDLRSRTQINAWVVYYQKAALQAEVGDRDVGIQDIDPLDSQTGWIIDGI